MNPLYLGTRERRLFGIHQPPAVKTGHPRAAVLCYPWGSEYVYAHRSMRELAVRLSQAGYHTLRFDFFGTGDSSGEPLDVTLAGWQADTEYAVEGLKDIAGARHVALIGLRVGGTVAAKTAARLPEDVDALVLWDPIVSGPDYLRSMHIGNLETDAAVVTEVKGFPISGHLLADFRAIDLGKDLMAAGKRSLVLVTDRDASRGEPDIGLPDSRAPMEIEYIPAACPWLEDITMSGAVPVQAIQRIVEWLS